MSKIFFLTLALLAVSLPPVLAQTVDTNGIDTETHVAVVFKGGYDTNPIDRGRPVILIASALNVPPAVFREAFSHVKPAPAGESPEPGQVQLNKQALMSRLEPYGITNERLDEVSNYYRYNRSRGEWWRYTKASAYATVRNGVVTGFVVTNPGSGYSSAPQISVPGMAEVQATATLAFGTDFKKNGSIKEITVAASR